jgi:hypothetical protein
MEKSEQFDLLSSTEKGSEHGKEEDQEEEETIPLTERNSSKNTEAALIGWRTPIAISRCGCTGAV